MVSRWQCRHCSFTLWAANSDAAADPVATHLLQHAASNLTNDGVRTAWRCPYCDTQGQTYAGDGAVEAFKSHLFEHETLETGVHMADAIGRTGSALLIVPTDGAAAANARTHFLSRGDDVLIVTASPAARLRLLDETLDSWPTSTRILTTAADPLASTGIDPAAVPLEIVTIDRRPDLSGLGETLASTLSSRRADGTLVVEFDILSELLATFELQTVFRFLHLLLSRLDQEDALSQFYLDPRRHQRASINVLEKAFDLSIRSKGTVFTAEPND
ncbi:DUF7504 family protein [Haloplanus aerogenes]|uniref:Uncharacterized protein n=1 Tax=Haloplanus aerogenes TaxID=660522 RepID=A0A3M0DSR1_9EURY|nr:hypothetical protein [Haloplanus aerogenes]AZH25316.1 hypothetical protein DU502_07955 [Haloplanus aerogenes]RMB25012.1 hypothetical protein ATH50_0095 [Haloplanus aerogenes]